MTLAEMRQPCVKEIEVQIGNTALWHQLDRLGLGGAFVTPSCEASAQLTVGSRLEKVRRHCSGQRCALHSWMFVVLVTSTFWRGAECAVRKQRNYFIALDFLLAYSRR